MQDYTGREVTSRALALAAVKGILEGVLVMGAILTPLWFFQRDALMSFLAWLAAAATWLEQAAHAVAG